MNRHVAFDRTGRASELRADRINGTEVRSGISFDVGVRRPFVDNSEPRLFRNALERSPVAGKSGFDSVRAMERHFQDRYSRSSARTPARGGRGANAADPGRPRPGHLCA